MRLKPGSYPRGVRPFVFVGDYHGDHIPGCIVKPGVVICPADAAWRFAGEGLQPTRVPRTPPEISVSDRDGLYMYQQDGANFLANHDWALLADEMGLGKTAQALRAAQVRADTESVILILCPALAKHHWAREVKRWTRYEALILDGLAPIDLTDPPRYIIANYDILYGMRRRDAAGKLNDSDKFPGWGKMLAALEPAIVICDEAHMLRGQKSRRTTAVKNVAAKSTCVWLLTGTPMPNHVKDLWALWDLASNGLAGWYWPWAKAYAGAEKGIYGWRADGASRVEELRNRLSFWMLGRTKAEVGLQLPPFRREVVPVDVGKVHFGGEDWIVQGEQHAVDSVLRATARAKRPAVVEMAKEALAAGQKVVVFVYLREQAEAIGHELRDSSSRETLVLCVTGAQSPEQRDASARTFRAFGAPAAFVATIDSVGVAISLVGADLVIFGDLSYEPAKLLQAEGRVHRIGSTSPVLCRYVTAAGTIDDAVIESVVGKLDTFQDVLGANPELENLQSSLGYVRPSTDAIVASLFERLVNHE